MRPLLPSPLRPALLIGLPLASLALGCVPPEGVYDGTSADKQDNASGERWRVPATVLLQGDENDVAYTGAGPWNGTTSCQGGMTPGADLLLDYLLDRFSDISTIGGYACRPIVGRANTASVHSTGRALDIMLPVGFAAEANNFAGDPIGNFLIANADDIGIQFVIWDRTSWGAHREDGTKERYYSGKHPHNDHLHVELSVEAGRGETPWLQENWVPIEVDQSDLQPPPPTETTPPTPPTPIDELPPEPKEDEPEEPAPSVPPLGNPLPEDPEPSGVCAALPTAGGVLDSSSNCLWLRGPSNYWKRESRGHDDDLAWTTALHSGKHLSSAQWEIALEKEGNYKIEVYVEPEFASFNKARYYVAHADSTAEVIVDLSTGDGWTLLGTYAFAAGGSQGLTLFDNSDGAVGEDQRVVVDAIRLTPENEEPADPVDPVDPGAGDPNDPPDPGDEPSNPPGSDPQPDPADDGAGSGGLVTNGCQTAPGRLPGSAGLFLILSLFALRRRRFS